MAVCKSNAYGHGLYDLAPLLEGLGVDWFGVDSIVEAVTLREKGVRRPLLVLGYTLPSRLAEAQRHGVSLSISSLDSLRDLGRRRARSRFKIHLKLDTGMHRQGLLRPEWPAALALLKRHRARVACEGLYTHFAAAKDPARTRSTREQIREFDEAAAFFRTGGLTPPAPCRGDGGGLELSPGEIRPGSARDRADGSLAVSRDPARLGKRSSPEARAELANLSSLKPKDSARATPSATTSPRGCGALRRWASARSATGMVFPGAWGAWPRSLSGVAGPGSWVRSRWT